MDAIQRNTQAASPQEGGHLQEEAFYEEQLTLKCLPQLGGGAA